MKGMLLMQFKQATFVLSAAMLLAIGSAHAATTANPAVPVMPTEPPASSALKTAVTSTVSSTLATTYSGMLNGTTYGMTCDNDLTVQSDGGTADTDGLVAMIAAAAAMPYGAELVLPPGLCVFNKSITVPVSASMRFNGAGIGLTTLQFWTPDGVAAPVGNGLSFNVTNNASLTVDDFTINRRLGSNLGTVFVGTAISIAASSTNPQAGNVTTTNLAIYPAFPQGQTDSWNIGLQETNIAGPVISNVSISLPGWGNIPDPGGYQCMESGTAVPCAIHTLPSPANVVATPANLAYGQVATGVALGGSGSGHFQIDSVINALTVSGGLVGLDLVQFQGAYITDSKFASNVYGIRADTVGTTSELLAVNNSLFTDAVGGIYSNGIGGMQVTGNYIQAADNGTNLPSWTAVWANNDNNDTVANNNIIGSGGAAVPEYGIWHSSYSHNSFPATIAGNTLYSLSSPGSVCLGNDVNMQGISATGNSLYACADYVEDLNTLNGYSDNVLFTPSQSDSDTNAVSFPNSVTIGTIGNAGSLSIDNNAVQQFNVSSNGSVTANRSITAGSNITSSGAVIAQSVTSASTISMTPSTGHYGSQQVVGNFYFPWGNNATTVALVNPKGAFPAFTGGVATMFGELTCNGSFGIISWHVAGHYSSNGTTITPGAFSATPEADADTQAGLAQLNVNASMTPIANPTSIGLEVAFGKGVNQTVDCSAMLSEMVAD